MDRPGLGDGRTEIKHLGETAGGPGLKGPRLRSLIRQTQTVRASLCLNGNLQMENQACFVVHRQFVVKEAWRLVVSWFQLSALTRRTIRVRPAISLADSILQTGVDRAMCLGSRHGYPSQHLESFKCKPGRPGFRPGILSLPAFSSDVCLDHASASLGPRASPPARRRQALGDAQEFKFQNIARASRSRRARAPAVPVESLSGPG